MALKFNTTSTGGVSPGLEPKAQLLPSDLLARLAGSTANPKLSQRNIDNLKTHLTDTLLQENMTGGGWKSVGTDPDEIKYENGKGDKLRINLATGGGGPLLTYNIQILTAAGGTNANTFLL